MNQIVINFEECDPAPSKGYQVWYKKVGTGDPFALIGTFFTSPAVFSVPGDPGDQYTGIIVSKCFGNDGNPVSWTTGEESSGSVIGANETTLRIDYSSGTWRITLSDAVSIPLSVDGLACDGSQNPMSGCSEFEESDLNGSAINLAALETSKTQAGVTPLSCSVVLYKIHNSATINGNSVSNGSTIIISGVTIHVIIYPYCNTYPC